MPDLGKRRALMDEQLAIRGFWQQLVPIAPNRWP